MDHYPQPRPVMYGTHEDDAPPQTQTAPVREGPPRWPPAPPLAGDWGGDSGDNSRQWHNYMPAQSRSIPAARGRFVVATLYALASVYALYEVAFVPQEFAGLSLLARLFLLLQIGASVWVVLCLLLPTRPSARIASGICVAQLALGIAAGEWLAPGTLVAVVVLSYLFYRAQAPAWDSFKALSESSSIRYRGRGRPSVGRVPKGPDEWRVRF